MGSLPRVWNATLEALEDLNIPTNIERKDESGGLIKGVMHDGTKVSVRLKMISDNQIEVGVRVGLFGDREYSELVQKKITSRFEKQYPSA